MVVSDIHYELESHRGIWEGDAHSWLLKMLDHQKPTALIGLGDFGHAWTEADWKAVTDLVPTHMIYGNHDNVPALRAARNGDGSRCLAGDGERRRVDGLEFGFINGIIAGSKKVKDGVERQTADEYIHAARRLVGVDVLCTHMAPRELATNGVHETPDLAVMQEVLEIVGPRILLCGHLSGPYKLAEIGPVKGVRVDSSPSEKHYAVISRGTTVEIFNDYEAVVEAGPWS